MKKPRALKRMILAVRLAALAFFLAPAAGFAADGTEASLRIGLAYGANAPSSCEIASASGFILAVPTADGFLAGMPLPAYTRLTVSASGGRTMLHADGGVLVSDDIGAETCVLSHDYASSAPILYEGVPYRGGLSFRPNANNTFNVINRLGVEEYLYGVLNSEMGYKNPPEALKAQAVAARSYTMCNLNTHADDGFDLCAGAHCQVYKGYADEYAETCAAVDGTAGLLLYHSGVPVSGNYFKNSGGHTQNAEDVWTAAEAYLRGVPDAYSPPYTWGWQLSFRELRALLTAAGEEDPGEVAAVFVSERNASGNVNAVTIIGGKGTVVLEKNRIRTVLGASNVKSLRFTFGGALPALPQTPAIRAVGADGAGPLASGAYVLSADGFGVLETEDAFIEGASGRVRASERADAAGGGQAKDEPVTGDSVTFTGSGYGHGVGLPQDSAIEMANRGYDFRRILMQYFTDIQIG
ncbi:MAG: SpoIID/LytB domain-containing protein [Clostridiales Family XIII bacterium]|jgi:stage II sporulation protein D|nr:SpoIID/LytB domain-containing protein [Clostridiales Family XIII bacterium]